jgi:N-acetylmuramoyl-L-alanine amidase
MFAAMTLLSQANLLAAGETSYIRYKACSGQKYVYLSDLAKYYGMVLTKGREGCEIRSRLASFSFTYEKRAGLYNGVKIHYLFAPVFAAPEPLVSEKDYKLILDPLIRGARTFQKKPAKTVLIDPGHGGKDSGAQTRYREKDLNMAISRKLRTELQKKGFTVYMTRDSDVFIELENRPAKALSYKADIFISIHCNSAQDRYVRGIETYYLTPEGSPSTSDKKSKNTVEKGNSFNKQNLCLAYLIQRCALGNTGADDRGVRHARFAALRGAPCPAVLVECGFMTNGREEKNLAWSKYQEGIAEGIAEAIVHYNSMMK